MALVPAFCESCGTTFASAGIFAGNARESSLKDMRIGPCPTCGGSGRVPDGVYDFIGDTIRVLSAPDYSRERLERLTEIIKEGRARGAVPEEVASHLQEEAPELAPVIDVFIQQKADPLKWIYLLLTIIGALLQAAALEGSLSDEDVERVNRGVVEELREHPSPPIDEKPRQAVLARHEPKDGSPQRPNRPRAAKRKKTGKTYGQHKKKRRRH
jgi:hypothetical protein